MSIEEIYSAFGLRDTKRTHYRLVETAAIASTYNKMNESERQQAKTPAAIMQYAKRMIAGTVIYHLLEAMMRQQKEFKSKVGLQDAELKYCFEYLMLSELEKRDILSELWTEIKRNQLPDIWKEVKKHYEANS